MEKPYIVCHMMMSADGRIDCGMTEKISGVNEYYDTLNALETTSTLSGRNTAELEMALPGKFQAKPDKTYGRTGFSKNSSATGYQIVADSRGKLLWPEADDSRKPLLIISSEKVNPEYLDYLDARGISWIACGRERIDLAGAMDILKREFSVDRLGIVGGGNINGAFLDAGLLDEISILIGPAIDGRKGMTAVFDGIPMDREPFQLALRDVTKYENGAVWLRYDVKESSPGQE